MLIEQVDRLCPQSLQRALNGIADALRPAVESGRPRPSVASQIEPELRGDDDFVPMGPQASPTSSSFVYGP